MITHEVASAKDLENLLLERFGDQYLEDTIRIISTQEFSQTDNELIHEALSIVLSIYTNKIKNGEINKSKVFH